MCHHFINQSLNTCWGGFVHDDHYYYYYTLYSAMFLLCVRVRVMCIATVQ